MLINTMNKEIKLREFHTVIHPLKEKGLFEVNFSVGYFGIYSKDVETQLNILER
jgi:hypothetical protein